MARIRTIKPEYWTDEKVLRLPDSTALFFISLWGVCDDDGYFVLDSLALAKSTGRWGSQAVQKMVSCLSRLGLVRVSKGSGVGLVEGWSHQWIKNKRPSKWKDRTIEWDTPVVDAVGVGLFLGREGKGKGGEGRELPNPPQRALEIVPENKPKRSGRVKPEPGLDSKPSWENYCAAYKRRYGAAPVRNATVNGQMANFIKRVGAEEAPLVAEFYVQHNDAFYVRSMHSVGILLKDAEKLRTEWVTGNRMNGQTARDVERRQNNFDSFAPFIDGAKP